MEVGLNSNYDRQPNSYHANIIVIPRLHIPPCQGRSLYPYRSVTISAIAQDHPLPDASYKLSRIDGRFPLLLLQHILSVLVEVERLLSPLLLNQQDHQAAQGVFVGRILLKCSEE